MNLMTWWLVALSAAVIVLAVIVGLLLAQLERTRRTARKAQLEHTGGEVQAATTGPVPVAHQEPNPPAGPAGASPPSLFEERYRVTERDYPTLGDLLAPPPMVGRDTLRDWLIYYRKDRNVWSEVTEEFYARAAGVPAVADYFAGVSWPDLKRHFTATMVIITHSGVTRAMPATMSARHRDVRNSNGDPITDEIFDAVIDTLAGVLRDYSVPTGTLNQLGRTVAPFRAALVRVPKGT